MSKQLSEFTPEELSAAIEKVLAAFGEFLAVEFSYDYEVESYTAKDGLEKQILKLRLSGGNDSLLIGHHGRTLEGLQHLLSLGLSTEFKQIVRVSLDVSDYRDKRTSSLEGLAQRLARQVIETNTAVELEPMSAAERRIIHNALMTGDSGVRTESTGEGRDRRIVILPADAEMPAAEPMAVESEESLS